MRYKYTHIGCMYKFSGDYEHDRYTADAKKFSMIFIFLVAVETLLFNFTKWTNAPPSVLFLIQNPECEHFYVQ